MTRDIVLDISADKIQNKDYDLLAIGAVLLFAMPSLSGKTISKKEYKRVLKDKGGLSDHKIKKFTTTLLDMRVMLDCDDVFSFCAPIENSVSIDSAVMEYCIDNLDTLSFKVYIWLKAQGAEYRFSCLSLLNVFGYRDSGQNNVKMKDTLKKLEDLELISYGQIVDTFGEKERSYTLFQIYDKKIIQETKNNVECADKYEQLVTKPDYSDPRWYDKNGDFIW